MFLSATVGIRTPQFGMATGRPPVLVHERDVRVMSESFRTVEKVNLSSSPLFSGCCCTTLIRREFPNNGFGLRRQDLKRRTCRQPTRELKDDSFQRRDSPRRSLQAALKERARCEASRPLSRSPFSSFPLVAPGTPSTYLLRCLLSRATIRDSRYLKGNTKYL